jgi:integral membrane protein (TIGR01906 family)
MKQNRSVYVLVVFLLMISMMCFLVLSSVQFSAFNMGFYEKEFKKFSRAEAIGTTQEALLESTGKMLAYYKGQTEDPQSIVPVNGVDTPIFKDRELLHIGDVKELFKIGFFIRNLSGIAVLLISGIIYGFWGKREFAKSILWATVLGLFMLSAILGYILLSFETSFTYFHLLTFDNDLWRLDPATENLIKMFPQEFFLDIMIRIALTFMVLCAVLIIASLIWLVSMNRPACGVNFRVPRNLG